MNKTNSGVIMMPNFTDKLLTYTYRIEKVALKIFQFQYFTKIHFNNYLHIMTTFDFFYRQGALNSSRLVI